MNHTTDLPKEAILSDHANRFPVKMDCSSMEDEDYRELLEAKRFSIIQHLQIDRTFVFDYLRHKGVLDSEDCELIQTERTTSLKIGKFVDILGRKGPQGYQYLLESLQLENPALYEKLTGEKADATTSPIMLKLRNSFIGVGGPLGNSELEILTRHLERTYGDLHEMSQRFEQVVQHKKDIEEQLETTTSDLEKSKEKVDFLKKKIDSQKIISTPENNNWPQCVQYIDNMRKEISNRDIYIIALQANLMSSREEIEGLKRKNDNFSVKNEELQKMVKKMNESYHKNKCESLRLSERIERQGNEIKKAEQTMRKYRECQFNNMRLREEKEHLQEELDELTKWTDALKTRYDIVEYEKKKTMSDHTVIMADFGSLQEELMKCREETNESQLLAADLKEQVRHLEHDRQTYKRQRDGAFAARREAILDRDRAFIERDQAIRKNKELKACNHASIEEKIWQVKSYDEVVARCDVMEEELKQTKLKLRKTERELEELKVKCRIEDDIQSEDGEEKQNGEAKVPGIEIVDSHGDISEKISEENISRSSPSPNNIVQSIKRRMAPPSPTFPGTNFPTFDGPHSSPFINSDSIFGTFSLTRFAKESASKEGGLDRKGVSRMPIKLRQNDSKENLFPEETQNEVPSDAEVVNSQNSDENTQQSDLEQDAAGKQNSDGSGSSKVVLYL